MYLSSRLSFGKRKRRIDICPLFLLLGSLAIVLGGCSGRRDSSDGGRDQVAEPGELPDAEALRAKVDDVLDYTRDDRVLDLDKHAAWQILHGVLAYGRDFEVVRGGKRHRTLEWTLGGGHMDGWSLRPGPHGLIADLEAGSKQGQGHPDQWLAVLAQCDLPSAHPVIVSDREYSIADLLKQAMYDTYEGKECSWTIIALSEYLKPDQAWIARDGSRWTLERMVAMEAGSADDPEQAQQQINGSACGGSHRLIAMAMALDTYRGHHPNRELAGGWATARQRIDWAIEKAKQHQLPSGAFSVGYFQRPSGHADLSEHLAATGHTLEFLSIALDEEELAEPWVVRSVAYLCHVFDKTRALDLECGKLYHAAHGLVLYRQRRWGPRDSQTGEPDPDSSGQPSAKVAGRSARDPD